VTKKTHKRLFSSDGKVFPSGRQKDGEPLSSPSWASATAGRTTTTTAVCAKLPKKKEKKSPPPSIKAPTNARA